MLRDCIEVPGGHDAESLATVIQEGFDRWQIGERVLFATTDNGGNKNYKECLCGPLGNTTHSLYWTHITAGSLKCFDVRRVSTALAHCRKLVGFFHQSYKMTYELREKQQQLKIKQHKLIQDCVTRWGSTLSMIERILEQRLVVCAVFIENINDCTLILTANEFTVLEELASVLNPI